MTPKVKAELKNLLVTLLLLTMATFISLLLGGWRGEVSGSVQNTRGLPQAHGDRSVSMQKHYQSPWRSHERLQ